jgi:DNA-binding ferritin-like protein (Dps family)
MSFPNQTPPPVERRSFEAAAAEAESTPLAFDPSTRAKYIRDMMKDIQQYVNIGLTEDEIKSRVGKFAEDYPQFFKKIIDKEDLTPIHTMLGMLDFMGHGRINQHQASMVVGTDLYKKFVEPQIRNRRQRDN